MQPRGRIISFLLLAFGFTWAIAGIGALFGVDASHGAYTILAASCMLCPAIAALVQWRLIEHAPWSALGLHPRSIRWRGLWCTVAIAVCIMPLALLVVHLAGDQFNMAAFGHAEVSGERLVTSVTAMLQELGVTESPAGIGALSMLPGALILLIFLAYALVASFSVNLPFMLGEELGWRGFLYEATASWSPVRRVAFTGPVWGVWHAPLILMGHNYPGYPIVGILLMMVLCTLLSILFDHARTRANSVWAACILHGMINGTAGLFALFAWDGHVLVASPAGVAGCAALIVLGLAVFVVDADYRRTFFRKTVLNEHL